MKLRWIDVAQNQQSLERLLGGLVRPYARATGDHIGVGCCVLGESKVIVGSAQPSVRSGDDKDPPFAQCGAHDAGNAGFLVEVRRVDNSDVDRNRKVAKLIEYAHRGVMAATEDRHDDEQVDVSVGAVASCDRAVKHDAVGVAPLDNSVGDS